MPISKLMQYIKQHHIDVVGFNPETRMIEAVAVTTHAGMTVSEVESIAPNYQAVRHWLGY
jgi:hypothetical protein